MYESPIEVMTKNVSMKMAKEIDNMVYKKIIEVGIDINKDELIKALEYDRNQYSTGYEDGSLGATRYILQMLIAGDPREDIIRRLKYKLDVEG